MTSVTVEVCGISATRCSDGTVWLEDTNGGGAVCAASTDELRALLDVLDAAVAIADRRKADG